jgi:N-acetyl-D-muramate 6-phosphate phosphatase
MWKKRRIHVESSQRPAQTVHSGPRGGLPTDPADCAIVPDMEARRLRRIRSVVFDVGETLIDDTREWGRWADWIGVPRHTFSAVLGAVTAEGRDNAETFQYFRPGFDLAAERWRREQAGAGEHLDEQDLYPDVRPALKALRDAGIWVGIAGNQTARAAELLHELDLPADAVATSGQWGVAKPDPAFFERVITFAQADPNEIVYVGDHRDNDILPAHAAGLHTVLIRRGPWGHLWSDDPAVHTATNAVIDTLDELAVLINRIP